VFCPYINPRTQVGDDLTITITEDGDFSCSDPSAFNPALENQPVTNPCVIPTKAAAVKHVDLTVTVKKSDQVVHLKVHPNCIDPHKPID
jgi:hypothetical protein